MLICILVLLYIIMLDTTFNEPFHLFIIICQLNIYYLWCFTVLREINSDLLLGWANELVEERIHQTIVYNNIYRFLIIFL